MKVDKDQIEKEWNGFRLLRPSARLLPHLVRPLDEARDTPTVWIVPLLDAITIHAAVCEGLVSEAWAGQVYNDILDTFELFWLDSRIAGSPALEDIYCGRVDRSLPYITAGLRKFHRLRTTAGDLMNLPVTVNGSQPKPSLAECASLLAAQIHSLQVPHNYTIHGDEHALNIMLYRRFLEAEPSSWVLVDYAAAENQSDWLIPIAKMLWWWNWKVAIEVAASTNETLRLDFDVQVIDRDGILAISYNEDALAQYRPSAATGLVSVIGERAERIASTLGEGGTAWKDRLTLAQVALLFSSSKHQFALSKAAFGAPILLAEGLKLLWSQLGR